MMTCIAYGIIAKGERKSYLTGVEMHYKFEIFLNDLENADKMHLPFKNKITFIIMKSPPPRLFLKDLYSNAQIRIPTRNCLSI